MLPKCSIENHRYGSVHCPSCFRKRTRQEVIKASNLGPVFAPLDTAIQRRNPFDLIRRTNKQIQPLRSNHPQPKQGRVNQLRTHARREVGKGLERKIAIRLMRCTSPAHHHHITYLPSFQGSHILEATSTHENGSRETQP